MTAILPSRAIVLLCSGTITSFTHFFVLTWDFFFNFKEDFMLEKFTLVIYAPSLLPPQSLSFLIACLLVKQKSHAIRNIGFLCLLTYSSLWPLYLLWALSAPGTFYACNHFLCTWDDLISTFLMQMPFTFLSGLVRLLSSSTGTVWKRSAESDSPVLFFPEESFQLFSTGHAA